MTTIRRYNVVLNVADSEVDYYVNLGYDVLDSDGNVTKKAMSTDVHTLQHELTEAHKRVEALEAENAELKSELRKLKTTKKKVTE